MIQNETRALKNEPRVADEVQVKLALFPKLLSMVVAVFWVATASAVLPVAPLEKATQAPIKKVYHSENSYKVAQRRPTPEESASMVAIVPNTPEAKDKNFPSCSGFLVANVKGLHLVATARHCAGFDMLGQCQKQMFKISPEIKRSERASCLGVMAGTSKDDMVIIQTHLDEDVARKMKPLRLAKYCPSVAVRQVEYGYPSDPVNHSLPTVTSNCIDNRGAAQAWDTNVNNADVKPYLDPTGDARFDAAVKDLDFIVGWSNCASYGGNSGGPVLAEGVPDVAIGMVTRYMGGRTIYPTRSSNPYEAMCGFYHHNWKSLKKLGVQIDDFEPDYDQIPEQLPPEERRELRRNPPPKVDERVIRVQ